MKLTITFGMLFFLLSCSNSDNKTFYEYYPNGSYLAVLETKGDPRNGKLSHYYPNGDIEDIAYIKDSLLTDTMKTFFPSGKLRSKESYQHNKKNGICIYYYLNGNIKTIQNYKDDLRLGDYKEYYENDSGKIRFEVKYIKVKDGTFPNYDVEYDTEHRIIRKRGIVKITNIDKYAVVNHPYHVNLELLNPKYPEMTIITGGFGKDFYDTDLSKRDTAYSKILKIIVKLHPKKSGWDTLRGVIENYKIDKKNKDGAYIFLQNFYFEYKYFVKSE